ncbi:hypothetical protein BFP72_09000 [Reichenbachiella sp. 5M10]|uniref:sensor histidine kinase n=1 Tax=Reichenbachiella sp. 5M10 TaxID=1889772 RepID=UPI000C14B4F6|nr:sensor histidine kinase [Reichenbachiella sp. 5M10]PIB35517.1 hypothetical protein BFP72_09000 [Reichenbachiella sp. 5M10]
MTKAYIRFSLALFYVIVSQLWVDYRAYAQEGDPSLSLSDLSISQWTTSDGLSSNNLTSVFQDSQGLIWVTSFNGVMIYDGERVEIFDKNSLSILKTDGFHCVAERASGELLLGSQGNGIVSYKSGKFALLRPKIGRIPKSVRDIIVMNQGEVYAGTDNFGLYRVHQDTSQAVLIEELSNVTVKALHGTASGDVWIGTEGKGVYGLTETDTLHFTLADGLRSNTVNAIAQDQAGRILIGTNGGLQYYTPEEGLQDVVSLFDIYVNCIMVDSDNSIWVGSELGVLKYDQETGTLENLYQKRGVELVRVSSLMMDKEDNIWVSSNRAGLIRLKRSLATNLIVPDITSNRVYIVHESWDGKLYIGSDQNLIDQRNGDSNKRIKVESKLYDNGVRDIYHDSDGSLWLATYGGVVHKRLQGETRYSIQTGMPANNFRTVLKDGRGDYWFGSRSGGLVKFRDGQIQRVYTNGKGMKSSFVLAVEESVNGEIYVGTHSGGLTIIDPEGQTRTYPLNEDDSGMLLFNMELHEDGTALLTSTVGLVYFDGHRLSLVELQSDGKSRTFFDVMEDDYGHIWVSSNKGVLKISKEEFESYLRGEVERVGFFVLDETNGMNNEECTGATRMTKLKNGEIYVPTLGGICIVDPLKVKQNQFQSLPLIRHVMVDNEEMDWHGEDEIEVSASVKRMTFQYSALSYLAPERNLYKFKLEGFDHQWSKPSTVGAIEYTNIPPGHFTFRVMSSVDGLTWSPSEYAFSFEVLPFFYETWWFYALVISMLGLIVGGAYRWRVAFINRQNVELKKVNAELDRFVYSASHEMRSPLSSILGLVAVARNDKETDQEVYFEHIEASVMRLDGFIKDIIDYSRNARLGVQVQSVKLNKMIQEILDDLSFTGNYKKIRRQLDLGDKMVLNTDPSRLKIVLSNLITNAFKHHAPDDVMDPFVSIVLQKTIRGVVMIVTDNGPGIDKKYHKDIFKMFYRATTRSEGSGLGLYMVAEIIAKLGGELQIDSVLGKGSTFTVELPDLPLTKLK